MTLEYETEKLMVVERSTAKLQRCENDQQEHLLMYSGESDIIEEDDWCIVIPDVEDIRKTNTRSCSLKNNTPLSVADKVPLELEFCYDYFGKNVEDRHENRSEHNEISAEGDQIWDAPLSSNAMLKEMEDEDPFCDSYAERESSIINYRLRNQYQAKKSDEFGSRERKKGSQVVPRKKLTYKKYDSTQNKNVCRSYRRKFIIL